MVPFFGTLFIGSPYPGPHTAPLIAQGYHYFSESHYWLRYNEAQLPRDDESHKSILYPETLLGIQIQFKFFELTSDIENFPLVVFYSEADVEKGSPWHAGGPSKL